MAFRLRVALGGLLHYIDNDDPAREVQLCIVLPAAEGHSGSIRPINGTGITRDGGEALLPVDLEGRRVVFKLEQEEVPAAREPFDFSRMILGDAVLGSVPIEKMIGNLADTNPQVVGDVVTEADGVRAQVLVGREATFRVPQGDPGTVSLPGQPDPVDLAPTILMEVDGLQSARIELLPLAATIEPPAVFDIVPGGEGEAMLLLTHFCTRTEAHVELDEDFRFHYQLLAAPLNLSMMPVPTITKFPQATAQRSLATLFDVDEIDPPLLNPAGFEGCNCVSCKGLIRVFNLDRFVTGERAELAAAPRLVEPAAGPEEEPRSERLPQTTAPVEEPRQYDRPQLRARLRELSSLIRAPEARAAYEVTGAGLTVAVIDSGLRVTHVDFTDRVRARRNFTGNNGGDPENVSDARGHGTNVTGIIAANGHHQGIAPGAGVIPLKAIPNDGIAHFTAIEKALQWVIDNRATFGISAVCMALEDEENYVADAGFEADGLRQKVQALREARVAVVVPAGNSYHRHGSRQGMAYPAILRECISVGAVYDAPGGELDYPGGAVAHSTRPDCVTPFSQRLHESFNRDTRTDVFAPGGPVTSTGTLSDHGESVQSGTSQAAPVIAGVVLLMQELYRRVTGELPAVDDLVEWLRRGAVVINDGDDEDDNVQHTGLDFVRVDALSALDAVKARLQRRLLAGNPAPAAGLQAAAAGG